MRSNQPAKVGTVQRSPGFFGLITMERVIRETKAFFSAVCAMGANRFLLMNDYRLHTYLPAQPRNDL